MALAPTATWIEEGEQPVARWEWVALAIALAVAATLRLVWPDLAYFNLHVGRDLYRALELLHFERMHLLGSEMQYGGRVFGPLVYLLYAIPLALGKSPVGVGIFIGLVNTGLVAWLWAFGRSRFGAVPAMTAAFLYATFPLEVVQLRFLWNPCFLPLMMMGMYYSLARFLEGGVPWWMLGVVAFFGFGFMLHFSVLMTLPALLLVLWMSRRGVPRQVITGMLGVALLLSLPFLWAEFRHRADNVEEAIRAPAAKPSVWDRHKPNPKAWMNLRHVVTFDWNEDPDRLGFTYLWFLRERLRENRPGIYPLAWTAGMTATIGHGVLWLAGMWALARSARRLWPRKQFADDDPARRRSLLALLLIAWQLAPLPFLTFFNYHTMISPGQHSLVPIRYYLVTFPVTFLIAGIGLRHLMDVVPRSVPRRALLIIPAGLCLFYACVVGAHLRVVNRSGFVLPYLNYHAPSLRVMLDVRDFLLDDLGLTADDYYKRVTVQNVFRPHTGEATLDYLVTQDPRAYTNDGLPEGRHVIIYAPSFQSPYGPPLPETLHPRFPAEPDGTPHQIVGEHQVGPLTLYLMEGGGPSGHDPFDPRDKRNFYYRDVRMKYLGRSDPAAPH